MRRFSSYGPVSKYSNYYAPRTELIERAYLQLVGEKSEEDGHYITVWAPRQAGKTWTMREILWSLEKNEDFDALMLPLEHLKMEKNTGEVLIIIGKEILEGLNKEVILTDTAEKFQSIFAKNILEKPLILILDEFDSLEEEAISVIVGIFRNIHNLRKNQDKPARKKITCFTAWL